MYQSNLKQFPLLFRGKVRDIYDLGEDLLIVATDRLSAFDVILPSPIPQKGEVLTQLTQFWLNRFQDVVPTHQGTRALSDVITDKTEYGLLKNRAVIVKKAKPLTIECVVRGYILGSGYKDYVKTGNICGVTLPKGLREAEKLSEPIFTPSTKAEIGTHDENIDFDQACKSVGTDLATKARDISLRLYQEAATYADGLGIIIADTKFEFGVHKNKLILIDEVLTPDSSRFWPKSSYQVGLSPPSYDKQYVRDYLETLSWNKKDPGPTLPPEVVQKTSEKYLEIYRILTGKTL